MARKPRPTDPLLRLGLCQHASPDGNRARNLRTASDMIRHAAGRGATLVVTQELFLTHYFPQREDPACFDLAEPVPGPTTALLGSLAKKLRVFICASLFEKRLPGVFHNTSVMIAPDGSLADLYRKMHVPDDPRFFEKYYFTPGDRGFRVQQVRHARTGMLVCWDQWYPEAARLTAMRGAQVLLYPTAIAWHREETTRVNRQQRDAWITIQRSHAIANGLFVAAVNRVGREGDLTFWGSSFVADPTGTLIAQAPGNEPCVLLADCDLRLIDRTRQAWPFFRDRRIDAYDGLIQRLLTP